MLLNSENVELCISGIEGSNQSKFGRMVWFLLAASFASSRAIRTAGEGRPGCKDCQPLDIDSSTASIGSMYAHSTPLPVRQNMNPHSFPSRTTQDPESPSTIQGSEISAVFNLNHFRKKLPKGRSRDKDLTSKNDPDIMIEAECRFKTPN